MRRLLFTVAVAILVWASVVVPVPMVALEPVPAQPVAALFEVPGQSDVDDDLRFTAVRVQTQSVTGSIAAWLDEHRTVTFTPTVVPAGVEPEEFLELQRRQFEESVRVAAAVGMEAAGAEVTIDGSGARVVRTVPGSPADGVLQQGDIIVEVGSRRVRLASEVAMVTSSRSAGEEVELTIRRGDQELTETLRVADLVDGAGFGIGVLATTVDLRIETPREVRARTEAGVGGPSAGLMIALAVYEATSGTDLAEGRTIAGTGTIDTSARVGPVDGIPEKVRGAVLAGAELFLVAEEQAETARASAPEGLDVVAVATLQDAVEALGG